MKQAPENHPKQIRFTFLLAVLFVGLLVIGFVLVERSGAMELMLDIDSLTRYIHSLGVGGPLIVIALMITAIVLNPLPSAPIALVSGAVYGHLWGTVYIVLGAEIGAVIAFMITRLTGFHWLQHLTKEKLSLGWVGSQNSMMVMVFISRLIPFLSFDLVSYGAGLTTITFWRFALATLIGLLPASFLLAHFGDSMVETDVQQLSIVIFVLSLIVAVPLIFKFVSKRRQ